MLGECCERGSATSSVRIVIMEAGGANGIGRREGSGSLTGVERMSSVCEYLFCRRRWKGKKVMCGEVMEDGFVS